MSGHNKWAQIKRQKGAADAAKSNLWGKLGKRISVESKKANGDVNSPSLRAVIEQAKKANMPKDTIERAVAKGTAADAAALEAITYETYGPGGAAIVIDALTDSRNRTAAEIKHLLSKNGLALAAPGSAAWAFERQPDGEYTPKTTVPLSEDDNAQLMKILEEIDAHDDVENVYTNAE
jgi:YebC/PmpR family DNA-binding regulatory protein